MSFMCSKCNEVLEVRYGNLMGGPPNPFVTHAKCSNRAGDCQVALTWYVVNEKSGRLFTVPDDVEIGYK
jgi:hypothetical protein